MRILTILFMLASISAFAGSKTINTVQSGNDGCNPGSWVDLSTLAHPAESCTFAGGTFNATTHKCCVKQSDFKDACDKNGATYVNMNTADCDGYNKDGVGAISFLDGNNPNGNGKCCLKCKTGQGYVLANPMGTEDCNKNKGTAFPPPSGAGCCYKRQGDGTASGSVGVSTAVLTRLCFPPQVFSNSTTTPEASCTGVKKYNTTTTPPSYFGCCQ